jgi:hypothetical protein
VDDLARAEDLGSDRAGSTVARAQLLALLSSVAWFELERRRAQVHDLSNDQVVRLVRDAGERSYAALLLRLGDYHGQSRFEVWAAKFAIHETAAATRTHNTTARLRRTAGSTEEEIEKCPHSTP